MSKRVQRRGAKEEVGSEREEQEMLRQALEMSEREAREEEERNR